MSIEVVNVNKVRKVVCKLIRETSVWGRFDNTIIAKERQRPDLYKLSGSNSYEYTVDITLPRGYVIRVHESLGDMYHEASVEVYHNGKTEDFAYYYVSREDGRELEFKNLDRKIADELSELARCRVFLGKNQSSPRSILTSSS